MRLDIDLQIRALARKNGSDLMSAPKVTVLSGKQADITVAQELRYPQSYGDIESTVSSGGGAVPLLFLLQQVLLMNSLPEMLE